MATATSKMLWVDKYRPTSLDSMDYHKPLSGQLKKMVESGNFPHLIVYGPSGAGKKTRIMALLKEIYGPSVLKLKVEHRSFKGTSKVLELMTVSSMYHIEMNPADVGNQDRLVVQEVIKEIAQSPPIDYGANKQKGFKVVVLNEVDKLSRDAQHALRRTMEKYISAFRLVMCCNSTSKVLEPVRSRCLAIRVPAPSMEEVSSVLQTIAKKEGFAVPTELANHIADMSKGNLRRAILTLEAMKVKQQPLTVTSKVSQPDWEEFIATLAKEIVEEQSPKRLQQVRVKLYELITHCIPPELIIKKLTLELLKKLDSEVKYEVMKWAAFYEHRLQLGTKAIFHLEAFIAKFMSIYKRFLINAFG